MKLALINVKNVKKNRFFCFTPKNWHFEHFYGIWGLFLRFFHFFVKFDENVPKNASFCAFTPENMKFYINRSKYTVSGCFRPKKAKN